MNKKPIVSVHNLSVRYEGHVALNDLTFDIQAGDIVAVVGPNGSGKTTLLRAILGLIPYEGKVALAGKIGYVSQRYEWDKTIPMTVGEFLMLARSDVGTRKLRHVLGEVDMAKQEKAQVGALSGGELQRVLIARAIIDDPALLLLDEATSGIDIAGAKSFYDIVSHLNQVHHTTVLMISHEINMVYRFANEIICLNKDLVCFGKPKDVITQEVLEKLYGKEIRFQGHKH